MYCFSGEEVETAIRKKAWWEGILEDIRPWNPLMVTSKKETWVRLFGVPVQLWREEVFKSILKPWGELIGLDDETSSGARFDVARVKLSSLLPTKIDFVQMISSQGMNFEVRVIEECGGPLQFVHIEKEEDQLGWSRAGSSCDSGDRGGREPELAMVEGGEFGETDSDGSEKGMQVRSMMGTSGKDNLEDKRYVEVSPKVSFCKSDMGSIIPSKSQPNETKGGEPRCEVAVEGERVRGKSLSVSGGGEARVMLVNEVVGQAMEKSLIPRAVNLTGVDCVLGQVGPGRIEGGNWVELAGGSLGRSGKPLEGPFLGDGPKEKCVIDKLEDLILETRGMSPDNNHEFILDNSNLSSASSSSVRDVAVSISKHSNRQKKPLSRLPFPQMLGPKCLRLVEVVNSVSGSSRRKKNAKGEEVHTQMLSEEQSVYGNGDDRAVGVLRSQTEDEVVNAVKGGEVPPSGVNIMLEDDLGEGGEDVMNCQSDLITKLSEAEHILDSLGLRFQEVKEKTLGRLVELEDRDRSKLEASKENQGFQ
jgi:hypothetical protein